MPGGAAQRSFSRLGSVLRPAPRLRAQSRRQAAQVSMAETVFFMSQGACGCGCQNRVEIPLWLAGEFILEPILVVGLGCSLEERFGF